MTTPRINLPQPGLHRPVLPVECEPVDQKNNPPDIVREELGKDARRWHMWGRICDTLASEGRVTALDLIYDGWIGEKQALTFIRDMHVAGILRPDGRTYRATRSGMVEYTVYCTA